MKNTKHIILQNSVKNQTVHDTYQALKKALFTRNRFNLFMSILGALILSIEIILASWLVQQSIDYVMGSGNITFGFLVLSAALIALLMLTAGLCVYFFRTQFTIRAVQQYRELATQIILRKSIADFERHNTAAYLSAMTNDVNMIKINYLDQIPIIVQILICSAGAVALMMYYNPLLTLIALTISLVPTLASMSSGKALAAADLQVSDENAQYMGKLKDVLNGFGVIKSCIASGSMGKNLSNQNNLLTSKLLVREKKLEKINYYAALSGFITQFAVLLVCVYFAVFKKTISAGTIVVFTRLITYIIDPVTNLPEMFSNVRSSLGMIKKFAVVLQTEEKNESAVLVEQAVFNNAIIMENLFYAYENGGEYVLRDWNITFEKGKKYMIVGTSGSGKSTLFRLLINTYPPTQGRIMIDHIPIHNLTPEALYKMVSIVYQKNFIFNDTILNNLTLFRDISFQELDTAIRRAALEDVIEKRGWDYICGEEGANLSGGECQRIAIARSYLCHTPVLLFDEATSALDRQTSSKVLKGLLLNTEETVIAITHVLDENVLMQCDAIIAVDKGRIAEMGSFSELMEQEGYFYSLFWASQK